MIRRNTDLLQVKKDNKWQWVFCYNPSRGIITTKDYRKSLRGIDLEYFQNKFVNYEFRITKPV